MLIPRIFLHSWTNVDIFLMGSPGTIYSFDKYKIFLWKHLRIKTHTNKCVLVTIVTHDWITAWHAAYHYNHGHTLLFNTNVDVYIFVPFMRIMIYTWAVYVTKQSVAIIKQSVLLQLTSMKYYMYNIKWQHSRCSHLFQEESMGDKQNGRLYFIYRLGY